MEHLTTNKMPNIGHISVIHIWSKKRCFTLLWATPKWNNNVYQTTLVRTMISWKRLPGNLYQTGQTGNRARQQRDWERVCVWEMAYSWKRKMASVIKQTIREKHLWWTYDKLKYLSDLSLGKMFDDCRISAARILCWKML